MDDKQRIELSKLINEYGTEETTDKIRTLRHSKSIKNDVSMIIELRNKYPRIYKTNITMFKEMCVKRSTFLFTNYTNIFNKLINNELDLELLFKFIGILESIENGKLDQHEASYKAGTILKQLYVDSALKRDENHNHTKRKKTVLKNRNNISWSEYKNKNINH